MTVPVRLLPSAISEMYAETSHSGSLTLADRYGLMAALLEESLEEEERRSIDRLLRAVVRGQIQLVDELSTVK